MPRISPASSLLNPDHRKAFRPVKTGDILNALIDALATVGYDVVPGTVDDGGLDATNADGGTLRLDLDHRLRAAMPNGPSLDPTSPDLLIGIRRAVESYDRARRTGG